MSREMLKLENQLCFPLYVCAKEMVKRYKPFLETLDLTYTQYITMLVLWEQSPMGVKALGEHLYLDSGTLTPVLKKLEQKGYLTRRRSPEDERNLLAELTPAGMTLVEKAEAVPEQMCACLSLTQEDRQLLKDALSRLMEVFSLSSEK